MGGAIFYGDQESVHPQRCPSSKDQVHGEPTLLLLTFPVQRERIAVGTLHACVSGTWLKWCT